MYIGPTRLHGLSTYLLASRTRLQTRSIVNYRPNLYSRLPETARKSLSVCACKAPSRTRRCSLSLPFSLSLSHSLSHRRLRFRLFPFCSSSRTCFVPTYIYTRTPTCTRKSVREPAIVEHDGGNVHRRIDLRDRSLRYIPLRVRGIEDREKERGRENRRDR